MKIIPLSTLRNTKQISDLITNSYEPIFITKQGSSHMVVMSHEYYEDLKNQLKKDSI